MATEKASTPTKQLTAKRHKGSVKIKHGVMTIGRRVVREGTPISVKNLYESVNRPTRDHLDEMAKKFGITWNRAIDNSKPADAKSGPAHSFTVEGKLADGTKVHYDRFQFMIFVNGNRLDKLNNVLAMTKRDFQKAAVVAA